MNKILYIKAKYETDTFLFKKREDEYYRIEFGEKNEIIIEEKDNLKIVVLYGNGSTSTNLIIDFTESVEIGKRKYTEFEILNNATSSSINLQSVVGLSPKITDFIIPKSSEYNDMAGKIVKFLRWKLKIDINNNWMNSKSMHWSLDNKVWNNIHVSIGEITTTINKTIKLDFLKDICLTEEPLYHDLCREAFELMNTNHRSALLIGATALESGVKKCISTQVENSDWLMSNIPSPPIKKIIEKYFPIIFNGFSIQKSDLKMLESMINERNDLVHKGKSPKRESIKKRLILIQKLLYKIDFHLGQKWACQEEPTD